MAWGWSNKKEEGEVKEDGILTDAESLLDVSSKIQGLLDNARNKFEDKYKDVKLRYDRHVSSAI